MDFVNLTPHSINLFGTKSDLVPMMSIKSSGSARCGVEATLRQSVSVVNGISVPKDVNLFNPPTYSEVEGLPDQKDGVFVIVSMLVKQQLPNRKDLCSPGVPVRDPKGNQIGCVGLNF